MKLFNKAIFTVVVLAIMTIALPAFSTGQTGGGVVDFGNIRVYMAEVTFTTAASATKVQLPVIWGQPDVWFNTQTSVAASELAITLDLDDFVSYGDGSTIAGDGIFTGSGLDDPLFVNLGSLTTTWQVECVVVAAGTFKSRITAADEQDPVGKIGKYGSYGATIAIPTSVYQAGSTGLGLDWNAAGGHTVGDKWVITNYADDEYLGATAGQISCSRTDLDGTMVSKPIFLYLNYDYTW